MIIGIDTHMLGQRETGNETYILELVQALTARDDTNHYVLYVEQPAAVPLEVRQRANVCVTHLTTRSSLQRLVFELPRRAEQDRLDVLHVTYNAPRRLPRRCALVVTIHDLSFEHHPEWFPWRLALTLKASVPRSARIAARVLTVSEFVKRDLTATYRLAASKICVTHEAASPRFHTIQDKVALKAVREKYGTGERFILCVGNLQPRKNLVRVMRAFALAKSRASLPHQLVIVGQPLWKARPILKAARELHDNVRFTGYVPSHDLTLLYNAAEIFCCPALMEGFGLPILEAMACGTPVITSNVSALPEVAGAAAYLVNPYDLDQLADALIQLASNETLRAEYSIKGLEQARLFSWDRTAEQTLDAYRKARSEVSG